MHPRRPDHCHVIAQFLDGPLKNEMTFVCLDSCGSIPESITRPLQNQPANCRYEFRGDHDGAIYGFRFVGVEEFSSDVIDLVKNVMTDCRNQEESP